jgi:Ca2+-binding EF-hand superfamily protein
VNVYKDTGSGQVKSLRSDVKPGQLSRLQTFSLLRQVMQLQLLEPLDDEELERVYAEMDIDNDGTVSFDEFFAWWKDNRSRLQGMSLQHGNRKLLWSAFQTFDEDSTGQIGVEDFDELVAAVSRQADILPLEAQEVQAMWNSKTILFEDFCNWWDRAKKIASTTDAKSKDSRFEKRLADIQKSNIPGSTVLVGIVNSVRTALRQLWKNARRAIGSFSHMIIKTAQIHEWSVQAWKFLTEEVPTTKHVTAAQGGKIFVLQFLAFLFPPLIFWAAVRKDYYMPVAARVDEFVKRMFWIVSMVALFTMHYNGVALNVTRSEVDGPIVMYLFLALMESAEEASLISSADQENSWKRQRLFSKFFLKCFPEKHHDDDDDSDEDESIAQPRNSAQKKRRKTRATQESGSNTLRLRDLDSARVREVRYDTFHRRELQNKHSTLLKHDPVSDTHCL